MTNRLQLFIKLLQLTLGVVTGAVAQTLMGVLVGEHLWVKLDLRARAADLLQRGQREIADRCTAAYVIAAVAAVVAGLAACAYAVWQRHFT